MNKKGKASWLKRSSIILIVIIFGVVAFSVATFVKNSFFIAADANVHNASVDNVTKFITEKLNVRQQANGEFINWYQTFDVYKTRYAMSAWIYFDIKNSNNPATKKEINEALIAITREIERQGIVVNLLQFVGYDEDNKKKLEIMMGPTGIHNLSVKEKITANEFADYCMKYDWV